MESIFKQSFQEWDKNGDGELDYYEWFEKMSEEPVERDYEQIRLWLQFSGNSNPFSRTNDTPMTERQFNDMCETMIKFQKWDKNGDGRIDKEEWMKNMQEFPQYDSTVLQTIWDSSTPYTDTMDELDFDEMLLGISLEAALTKGFKEWDKNSDGEIDREEFLENMLDVPGMNPGFAENIWNNVNDFKNTNGTLDELGFFRMIFDIFIDNGMVYNPFSVLIPALWAVLDHDGDGFFRQSDINLVYEKFENSDTSPIKEVFENVFDEESDASETIGYEEFHTIVTMKLSNQEHS